MNHLTEEQFVLYYYGEGDDAPAARRHLDTCETCRAEYGALQRVLNVVDAAPVPERPADYGAAVWSRLQPSIPGRRPFWTPMLWPARHWAVAMSMAALIIGAFLAGRYYPKAQQPAQTASAPAKVRERILLVAVGDHLERSQMVLVELMNARPGQALDISSERQRADDLVAENRLYRQTAARTGDENVAGLLGELEPVLLEIARGPSELNPEQLENLRRRIEAAGLLFKVRVVGSTVRRREMPAGSYPARKNL